MTHADTFINEYGEHMPAITEIEEDFVFDDITHLPCALDFVDTERSIISWYGEEYTVRPEFARLCSDFIWHLTKAHWVPCREETEFYAVPF